MSYVMFVLIIDSFSYGNGGGLGATSFQYEFKDKTQCENALKTMKRRFEINNFKGYCQEVRK